MSRPFRIALVLLFACLVAGQASGVATFDVRVTQINGSPIAPTSTVTVAPSDTVRVQLELTTTTTGLEQVFVQMSMAFDPSALTMVGPQPGPTTFHQPCSFSGVPCSLFPGVFGAPSGTATADDPVAGRVGAMGVGAILSTVAGTSGALGVVDFHVQASSQVVPFEWFPGVDGVFSDFGSSAQPFTLGPGVQINVIPEPTTALLVGCGLAGLALRRRR